MRLPTGMIKNMKKKQVLKQMLSMKKVFVMVVGVVTLIFGAFFFVWLFDFWDHIEYKHSVKTKEDVFQMIEERQEQYMDLVYNMETLLDENGVDWISCDKTEYCAKEFESSLFKEYPIHSVVAKENEENVVFIDVQLLFPPKPYAYWGIYYSSSDMPFGWGGKGELIEEKGDYVEYGSYYKYETEKITDNWYYYQCYTR